MQIDDIISNWQVDNVIDPTDVGNASLSIAKLHAKYLRFLTEERLLLRKLRVQYKELHKMKYEYYSGTLSEDDLKQNGWQPFLQKVLKTDLSMYIESDQDIVKLSLKIGLQEEKVDVLDSIIKSINNRGFQIKNYIDWTKFTNGAS
jgi:hypothetical protein